MKVIDSDKYLEYGIETMFFPGGEPHIKIPRFTEPLLLYLKLRTWADVGFAACLINALDWQGAIYKAFIPYFPGARQDKTDGTAPSTVHLMCQLLYTDCLFVFDPHSYVLMDDDICPIKLMPRHLSHLAKRPDVVGIIAPDEGATDRATEFLYTFYPKADLVQGCKERDSRTGRLSNYQLEYLNKTGTYIIVDDICDGGGTFNLLSDAFHKDPLASGCRLEMFVSHGIFSKGLDAIDPRIQHITTTDSWAHPVWEERSGGRLTVIPLLPNLLKYLEK